MNAPTFPTPAIIDRFINRTNAGDLDSLLETLAAGATIHHDGHDLSHYALDEFLASAWFVGGFIHIHPTHSEPLPDGSWRITARIRGRSAALASLNPDHPFALTFTTRHERIARLRFDKDPA